MVWRQMEHYFQKYYKVCRRVAFTMVKNDADAEDVAQETLLRLLLHTPDFKDAEHEKAWMMRTAINLSKDLLKSAWHKKTVGIEAAFLAKQTLFQEMHQEHDDTLLALMELPERHKNCLYLFYYEDYSIREIASVLEMPENTVKTNLRRGRELLRKRLGKDGNE